MKEFHLCPKLCFIQKDTGNCEGIKEGYCTGACKKLESPAVYNKKVKKACDSLQTLPTFAIIDKGNSAYVNFLKIINGCIIQAHTSELKKKLDESPAELLAIAILELRLRYHSNAKEVLVSQLPDTEISGVNYVVPKIGDKKHLIDLSLKI